MGAIELDELVCIEIEREGVEEIVEIALHRDVDMLGHIHTTSARAAIDSACPLTASYISACSTTADTICAPSCKMMRSVTNWWGTSLLSLR